MYQTPDQAQLALRALQDIVEGREYIQCLATWDSLTAECGIGKPCLGCKANLVIHSLRNQRDELILEIDQLALSKKLINSDTTNASR